MPFRQDLPSTGFPVLPMLWALPNYMSVALISGLPLGLFLWLVDLIAALQCSEAFCSFEILDNMIALSNTRCYQTPC